MVGHLTSASLGGDVPADPHDGETQMLHTILLELGCIGYSTTPDGRVFTDDKQCMETEEYPFRPGDAAGATIITFSRTAPMGIPRA